MPRIFNFYIDFLRTMWKSLQSYRVSPRGFSLTELSISMAVLATISAALTPQFLQMVETKSAQKTAAEMSLIENAALNFYNDSFANYGVTRWSSSVTELQSTGYLSSTWNGNNPWGTAYSISHTGANLVVSTAIPQQVAQLVVNDLPMATNTLGSVKSEISPPGTAAYLEGFVTRNASLSTAAGYDIKDNWFELRGTAANPPRFNIRTQNAAKGGIEFKNENGTTISSILHDNSTGDIEFNALNSNNSPMKIKYTDGNVHFLPSSTANSIPTTQVFRGWGNHKGSGIYISGHGWTDGIFPQNQAFIEMHAHEYSGANTNFITARDYDGMKFYVKGDGSGYFYGPFNVKDVFTVNASDEVGFSTDNGVKVETKTNTGNFFILNKYSSETSNNLAFKTQNNTNARIRMDDGITNRLDIDDGVTANRKMSINLSTGNVSFKRAIEYISVHSNGDIIAKPSCFTGTSPAIFLTPVSVAAGVSGTPIIAVSSWADDNLNGTWTVNLQVKGADDNMYTTNNYMKVVTSCL